MISRLFVVLALVGFATMALADDAAKGTLKNDAQAVDSACSSDSATAGCGSEKVGTGLLKCLHKYKKEHKDYKFSEGCKSAMKQMRTDRKEMKAKKGKS